MDIDQNNQETLLEEKETPTQKKAFNLSIPAAIIVGALIISVGIVVAFSPKNSQVAQQQNKPATTNQPSALPITSKTTAIRANDFVFGNRDAQVTVIEYSDSDCPFCKQFHQTMKDAVSFYKGKVSWVYRFLPLNIHPNAYTEALALTCVGEIGGNSAFWNYIDTLMNITLNADPKSNEALVTYATQAGVNGEQFTSCMKAQNGAKQIDADIDESKSVGARGTPFSIVVNTKTGENKVVPGAVSLDYIKQTIDGLLK